jgi:hypothetical protein
VPGYYCRSLMILSFFSVGSDDLKNEYLEKWKSGALSYMHACMQIAINKTIFVLKSFYG